MENLNNKAIKIMKIADLSFFFKFIQQEWEAVIQLFNLGQRCRNPTHKARGRLRNPASFFLGRFINSIFSPIFCPQSFALSPLSSVLCPHLLLISLNVFCCLKKEEVTLILRYKWSQWWSWNPWSPWLLCPGVTWLWASPCQWSVWPVYAPIWSTSGQWRGKWD